MPVIKKRDSARRRPKIGLVGFYNWGNFGDELFVEVFRWFLEPRFEVIVMPDKTEPPFYSRPIPQVVSEMDAIIIGGGELIVPWKYGNLYWDPAYLEKPVFVFGVGASIYGQVPQVMEKLRRFLAHPSVRLIHLRDDVSLEFVAENFSPQADLSYSPDIVFALDPLPASAYDDAPILGVVTKHNRRAQNDLPLLEALCTNAMNAGWRVRKIVLSVGARAEQDLCEAGRLHVPGAELYLSQDLGELSRCLGECRVLASMKLHGIIVAARYRVPSISLLRERKIEHAMTMLGLRSHISDLVDPGLPDRLDPPPAPISAEIVERLGHEARAAMTGLAERLTLCIG